MLYISANEENIAIKFIENILLSIMGFNKKYDGCCKICCLSWFENNFFCWKVRYSYGNKGVY